MGSLDSVMRPPARRDRLVTEIAARLPGWVVTGTAAGLHLLVLPPAGHDEAALVALARRCGLDARPLRQYAVSEPDRPGLVIGYGHQRPDALTRAVIALARHAPASLADRSTGTGARTRY